MLGRPLRSTLFVSLIAFLLSSGAEAAKFRAVVAGVTNYEGTLRSETPLKLDVAARQMVTAFRTLAIKNDFEDEDIEIVLLTDTDVRGTAPTRTAFIETLQRLADQSLEGDMLAVYFTGHGTKDFLHASGSSGRNVAGRIELSIVRQLVNDSDAGKKLVFVDACQGFNIRSTLSSTVGLDPSSILDGNLGHGAAWYFSSSRGQLSYVDNDLGYGIFTKHLLRALERGLADGWRKSVVRSVKRDDVVTGDELGAFLYWSVRHDANVQFDSKQSPTDEIQSGFVVYGKQQPELQLATEAEDVVTVGHSPFLLFEAINRGDVFFVDLIQVDWDANRDCKGGEPDRYLGALHLGSTYTVQFVESAEHPWRVVGQHESFTTTDPSVDCAITESFYGGWAVSRQKPAIFMFGFELPIDAEGFVYDLERRVIGKIRLR